MVLKELNINFLQIKNKLKIDSLPEGRGKKIFVSRYKKNLNLLMKDSNANPSSVTKCNKQIQFNKKRKI